MTQEEYEQDIEHLNKNAVSDLERLLEFAHEILAAATFKKYLKAKTVFRYNTFSALYKRTDAILALGRANQGDSANIIVRSMWETLVEYDFVNLTTSNINLKIRLASESKQQLTAWSEVKRLRIAHPKAETWKKTISDEAIERVINRRESELLDFNQSHPNIKLGTYQTLLSRLKEIDSSNLSKNPEYKTLTQFDYRSIYSLLSFDTHSTVVGNMNNTRLKPKESLEIRLDTPPHEALRAMHVAYKFFLGFLRDFNQRQKLNKGVDLKTYRDIDNLHSEQYAKMQQKYGF